MKFILAFTLIICLNFYNVHSFAQETNRNESVLKVALIVPLSGKNQEIGKSV